ncbi:MAG: SDR family oxidoreductase [Alphaproteobacteria bacterium]|nr:SDR family oxidoreductase [Alphaproteobacteria bacterium]
MTEKTKTMVDLVNELEGKVAIVTGSARNIGRVTAEELARAGAAVVINALSRKSLCEEVAEGICAAGGRAIPVMADCRDKDSIDAMATAAIREFGGIDILVHNAAVRHNIHFDDMTFDHLKDPIALSIHGMFHLAKATVPSMKQRGGGSIIGVGGMNSHRGSTGRSHLMAAKMGMNQYVRGLSLDLAEFGIRANQVVVGTYDTVRDASTAAPRRNLVNIPLGREGVPQDMANLVRYLVGPGGDYITGQTIHSNGGAFLNL